MQDLTDTEFIQKAKAIMRKHGAQFADVCAKSNWDKATLYLGDFGYMNREQLVEAAKDILGLEGVEHFC